MMPYCKSPSGHVRRAWLAAGVVSVMGILGAGAASAAAVPAVSGAAFMGRSQQGLVHDVRARGGGGGHVRGGGGGHFRGGGGHLHGGGHFRGGHRPYRYAPLLLAPPLLYGGYSYYSDDCRSVRVRERRCWVDHDGDRQCGHRWVVRRVCD